jgi:ribonuclease HI
VTEKSEISDCFRIFVDPARITNDPAMRQPALRGIVITNKEITIYTDGSCINNGKEDARCGSGIWFGEGSEHNMALRVPGKEQLNQVGELVAVVAALEKTPNFTPITIKTDSKYVIEGLTKNLKNWENRGWIGIKNKEWFKRAAYLLRRRTVPTKFKWVKGHSGELGNEMSDQLAKEGANKETTDDIPLEIPKNFDLQGVKLAKITQAIAYKGIQESLTMPRRRTTTLNLEKIRGDIVESNKMQETNESIWMMHIRANPIRTKIQQFFYKTIHGTQKTGRYWLNIPDFEERCFCHFCGADESMDHILTDCEHPARLAVWRMAKELWPHSEETWPMINLGSIIGCNTLSVKTMQKRKDRTRQERLTKVHDLGATRLLKILLSETAYLIQ